MRFVLAFVLATTGFGSSILAAPPALYHSPGDDGQSGGSPALVPPSGAVALHLYLGVGSVPSASDPCLSGTGDELCGHRVRLAATNLPLVAFAPADPDTLFHLAATQLDLTGGDVETGELGPTKLGDLTVDASAVGATLTLVDGEFVTSALGKEEVLAPAPVIEVPEPRGSWLLGAGYAMVLALRRHRTRCAAGRLSSGLPSSTRSRSTSPHPAVAHRAKARWRRSRKVPRIR